MSVSCIQSLSIYRRLVHHLLFLMARQRPFVQAFMKFWINEPFKQIPFWVNVYNNVSEFTEPKK